MKVFIFDRIEGDWPAKSSHLLLPELAQSLGYGQVSFSLRGKPYLKDHYCSVSHSRQRLVVAFSEVPIGIDLEFKRELRPDLVKRLRLNGKAPLEEWCDREAWIKLDDDPKHLMQQLPYMLIKQTLNLGEDWICKIVSRNPVEITDLIYETR